MIQDHLGRFPRFDGLSKSEIRTLERAFSAKRYRKGQVLMRQGDRARGPDASVYLVLKGCAQLAFRDTTGATLRRTLGPGELIGVIALVRDTERTATVTVNEPSMIATFDRAGLHRLATDNPSAWARIQHVIALQLAADSRAMHDRLSAAVLPK